jgi:luciferase family oxidoreductase group 1
VAEQFALLEAAHPGRIDLGIGRSPGTDPVTSWALRGPAGRDDIDVAMVPQYLDDVMALISRCGVAVPLPGRTHTLRATPAAASEPAVWLLGSSMYSARLAAEKGLPYVFAHHFSGRGTQKALTHYRENVRPSDRAAEPTTLLTVNASVAPTHEEALELAVPQMVAMARLRCGLPLGPLELVPEAAASRAVLPAGVAGLVDEGLARCVIGNPGEAAAQVRVLAAGFGVDEVMIHPVGSAYRGAALDAAAAREETLTLLAKELISG